MKSLIGAAFAAAAALCAPVLSHAQDSTSLAGLYGNLGYSDAHSNGVDLGAIQGRLGYRLNNYLGVEGELAGGVKSDHKTVAPGVRVSQKLRHQEALYGVGFLPLNEKFDLLGRVGYGGSTVRTTAAGVRSTDSRNSWNFGAGAQYHIDKANGVRADYTRQEFVGHQGGGANVWSVAYTRGF
jgi:opacity protein-like surface antigen